MSELRRAFDAAFGGAERRQWVYGLVGHPDGTIIVAGRRPFVYVRLSVEGNTTVTIAKNQQVVANQYNLPVRMRQENGVLVIHGVDSARWDAATSHDTDNAYGVRAHTHAIGSGLEYTVEAERLEPGLVYPTTGKVVGIGPFRYLTADGWDTWPGGILNLSSYQPTTSAMWAWVLVGVDPETNTATAYTGAEQSVDDPLTVDLIDAIDTGATPNFIPLGAVRMKTSDTAITDQDDYADARGWFNGIDVQTLIDTSIEALETVDMMVVFDDDFVFFDEEPVLWP